MAEVAGAAAAAGPALRADGKMVRNGSTEAPVRKTKPAPRVLPVDAPQDRADFGADPFTARDFVGAGPAVTGAEYLLC